MKAQRSMRSFLFIAFIITVILGSYTANAADPGASDVSCGDQRYLIEKSWLGANVSVMKIYDNATTERPYCQSSPTDQMVAELSVSGDDIWCVKTFYISMDRNPIAKSSRLLTLTLNRVIEYDYLWKAGDWVKIDSATIYCTSNKEPKRRKILD